MPRVPRRPLEPGLYHLTANGNRGQWLYLEDRDRVVFLHELAGAARPGTFFVRAYCLMCTHYHLLVDTKTGELSDAMRDLNGIYARWFNKEHGFRGRLFEERFHSKPVVDTWHLFEVLRYLALNPVRAGLCATPDEWRWGSFAALTGHTHPPRFLDPGWTLDLFSNDPVSARQQLASYVSYSPDFATP